MLNFFAADGLTDGGGTGVEQGRRRSIDGDSLLRAADLHLHVEDVGLFWNEHNLANTFLLEALAFDGEAKVIGREGAEVEDAAAVLW